MELHLYVYDYNYSSWSMRPGLLVRKLGVPFTETDIRSSGWSQERIKEVSPTGKFPILQHGQLRVWDSLAIAEYLAETFPNAKLWPEAPSERALARSVCAEMHSSFQALRNELPMNVRARHPNFPKTPQTRADIARIVAIWTDALSRSGGPYLFGRFTVADAFYAPIVMRMRTYDAVMEGKALAYAETICADAAVADWIGKAKEEKYRSDQYELVR